MANTKTEHTTLVRVTSNGSGGRGEVLEGHPATYVDFSDPFLTSQWFTKFREGSLLVTTISLTRKRRRVTTVIEANQYSMQRGKFVKDNVDLLVTQYRRFNVSGQMKQSIENASQYWENRVNKFSNGTPPFGTPTPTPTIVSSPTTPPKSVPKKYGERVYITPKDNKALEVIKNISVGSQANVMMVGASGYGKSSIPEQKAKDWDMDFLRWDCATVRDQEEFFGFRGAQNGSTMDEDGKPLFAPSKFTKALTQGNCVIVLDELNRIDPYILNILFPILDDARKTSVADQDIVVGKDVIFFATINVGHQFTGTFELDTALSNRFLINLQVGPLPFDTERKVLQAREGITENQSLEIVKLMKALRKLNEDGRLMIDASTRVSLQLATLIKAGMEMNYATIYI